MSERDSSRGRPPTRNLPPRLRRASIAGAAAWLVGGAALALARWTGPEIGRWADYGAIVVLASAGSFVMYGWDKYQATAGGRRIPEATLHFVAMIGGWPGAILGQEAFRHKTQKVSFRAALSGIIVLHVAAVGVFAATGQDPAALLPEGTPAGR